MIEIYRDKGNRQETHYKVCNYEFYQGTEMDESNSRVTENKQSTDTNKNEKNDKNEKNNKDNIGAKANRFAPPTLEEVTAYCKERSNGIDGQHFIDFYTAKNWMIGKNKMKDWKAAVRTWERKECGVSCGFKYNDNYREDDSL
ncbi:MAG: hypothetical protein VB064_02420 [Oscillospiraceae bacterium]|nr:hypothetical protein [Oscillospiraceae bacterium]